MFDEFDVTPGEGLDLNKVSGADGRSHITYVAKDEAGDVRYVGRAQGVGNPAQVLAGRLSRGHDIAKANPSFTFHVVDVQKTKDASKGAEEFFFQGYSQRGANLLNSPSSPPLGFSKIERGRKSASMMDAFFEDLFSRGAP
ncbi:hypothetical protein [Actinoplanes siamensis]|uniref:hypothetical protein n=1 Tax=Actinoplanes siamensis TaxID=1223317 RepID=UPI001943093A|nr:hypothetical protein [Actinoplanes siamensis]